MRYFFSDVAYWVQTNRVRGAATIALLLLLVAGGVYAGTQLADDDEARIVAVPSPEIFVGEGIEPEEPAELGFPAFATRNTTRVAGPDPIADAAGVALATFPTGGVVKGPPAVSLVDSEDWAGGVAASALVAEPIGAPVLLTRDGRLDELTTGAIDSLAPEGGSASGGAEAFQIGNAGEAEGLDTRAVDGDNAAEVAVEILELREKLVGDPPEHLLVTTSDDPEFAMPAAAWAARSGDPVLFAQADSVPTPTLDAIKRLKDVPVFILGPESVISRGAEKQIAGATEADVVRAASEDDPIANAVAFARFADGSFGWNINDPGHGFVIANTERPADAGAASALSGTGKWGPLLLTDDAKTPPPALEGYLLDLKPGYESDPTRAFYNHIWIIGDESALSVDTQVELDEIAELAQVESGTGDEILDPGAEKPQAPDDPAKDDGQ